MALQEVGGTETTSGISRLTTEYLFWLVDSDEDFSTDAAQVAFMAGTDIKPAVNDWNPADIVPNPDNAAQTSVRLLVGPAGGIDLTPETSNTVYSVWIKITTASETFVRRAGTLLVR